MSDECFDRESRSGGAFDWSIFLGSVDDDHVVYKRKRFHYQVEQEVEGQESGGEEFGEQEGEEEEEKFAAEEGGEEGVEEEEGVGEEGENYRVESDEEISSALSSNKRVKQMSVDRLSALPDSLLVRILSFLDMKEAAMTDILSKRWQFLWTGLPKLKFYEGSSRTEKISKFVAWVHRTLVICSGHHLEAFEIDFGYDKCFASDVNVWVDFTLKNKVKDVALLLNSRKDLYLLPQMMYSNSSLTRLSVEGCIISPKRTVEWGSLTTLYLDKVVLNEHVIEKIFSGCPALYELELMACTGLYYLKIDYQSLRKLKIGYWKGENCETCLDISAPYIHTLQISLHPRGRRLRLTNVASLVRANIDFEVDFDPGSLKLIGYTKELFNSLQHVKELEVGYGFLEVLSMLAVKGWRLAHSGRRRLTVHASKDEHRIPGILCLLESSPYLETMDISLDEFCEFNEDWVNISPAASYSKKVDLQNELWHLKTVNITSSADSDLPSEGVLTLAQLLLQRARVLEKMVIDTGKFVTSSSANVASNYIRISQMLLSYPRSSPKAVVLLH
ncbi:putative F-box/LRR-repeat protein At5g02930 [Sesamum indicum]|uniref:F-box/LRR-repeat protein At5g02930 n=1 Tax=Sesamum indicum TaxID=4182 RepID=A0A6I9SZW7_SESIN|nr:putative F-box/LRR-repeat protein At5g02930 [Sesamum indicum]